MRRDAKERDKRERCQSSTAHGGGRRELEETQENSRFVVEPSSRYPGCPRASWKTVARKSSGGSMRVRVLGSHTLE
jgi:hypothetical protein